ncbi:MAG: hypothetical protein HKM05_07330 [Spirochaetales bacterium]|nr:hypothetical protein [Spirochaetales bacterium]
MAKQRFPTWALAWLTGLVLAAAIFLANKDAVDRLMDATGLTHVLYPGKANLAAEVVRQDRHLDQPARIVLDQAPAQHVLPLSEQSPADPSLDQAPIGPPGTPLDQLTTSDIILPSNGILPTPPPTPVSTPSPSLTPVPTPSQSPSPTPTTQGESLYFLKMGPDGRLEPTPYQRELIAGTTPLTAVIRGLLMGPTIFEKNAGAITLIPNGTQLLSARVDNGTAFLSFSEEFTHNKMDLEGFAGQLKELVWTATQFPSVQRVQFLVNGQYRDSLGMDGLSIAIPLSRASFH